MCFVGYGLSYKDYHCYHPPKRKTYYHGCHFPWICSFYSRGTFNSYLQVETINEAQNQIDDELYGAFFYSSKNESSDIVSTLGYQWSVENNENECLVEET